VVAIEINVDSMAVAHVGFGGVVSSLVRVDRPRAHATVDEIAADLADLAAPVLSGAAHDGAVIGIGVAVAGVVRRSDGQVRHAPNLGWRDVPLGDRLAAAFGSDLPIAIANEADLGGLAELRRGAAVGESDVVYVAGEVGVGGSVTADGRQLIGAAGYAGEVGHMVVNPAGAACACGSIGCWETEIGERAMLVRAGRPPNGGRAAVDELLAAAIAGEPEAVGSLERVGEWLGIGLSSLVNVFNPRLVVLGGVLGRIHPLTAARVEAAIERRALPASAQLVRVVPGALGVDAPIIGAAELAFEPMLADPACRLGGSHSRRPVMASA
jgi:predicted NBD/HSP70 family sugar kinase